MTEDDQTVVLDLDQADLALQPTRTRVWAPIGVPYPVPTPGTNEKLVLFGAVNSRSGQVHVQATPTKRSTDFQTFLDQTLLPAYPDAEQVILLVDGASIYQSKSTRAWLQTHPRVVLVPLPTYAPEHNLQEHIWGWLRADVTHNHAFPSLAALRTAADEFFAGLVLHPAAVLQRIGRSISPFVRVLATIP